jgi:hypothetical protein
MENTDRTPASRDRGLLEWQLASYDAAHRDRKNLALHLATVPVFMAGTVASLVAPAFGFWLLPAGLGAMLAAMAIQGKGHARETQAPAPFEGPRDVLARIFVEQWITFPRFVISGGFARAWRDAT